MIINNSIQSVTGAYTKNSTGQVKPGARADIGRTGGNRDEIVLSDEAKSFSAALQQVQGQSDMVRTDKVSLYASQMAAGTYIVDANAVAGKMLQMRY
jgi:flagellar biosynthesis anti-sigma factor FlgM